MNFFHCNVSQFLLSSCPWTPFWRIHSNFWCILKCLSACFLLSKPILELAELDTRKNPGVNFFHCNVSQFLLSSCPWTPFSRIHSNFWCILKCLSACFLLSKPILEHVQLDKRKKPSVNICFHRNVSQFLLSKCYRRFFQEYIWTFDVVLKCLSACILLSKPLLEHVELDKRKKPSVNICFHHNVRQFLLSRCCRRFFQEYIWTFDVVLKCLSACFLLSKLLLKHAEFDKKKKTGVNFGLHRNC